MIGTANLSTCYTLTVKDSNSLCQQKYTIQTFIFTIIWNWLIWIQSKHFEGSFKLHQYGQSLEYTVLPLCRFHKEPYYVAKINVIKFIYFRCQQSFYKLLKVAYHENCYFVQKLFHF